MPATTPSAASQADALAQALRTLHHAPLPHAATALLSALGYTSARIPTMPDDSPDTFVSAFPTPGRAAQAPKPETNSEREFKASAQAVHILFQISDTEIPEMPARRQAQFQTDEDERPRFAWSQEGRERSFIFAAVQLKPRPNNLPYSRGHYARFAREINKRIVAPVVALFQTQDADEISIAFIGRRPSKTQPDRDVLERVSVIRGVSLDAPHAAHIRILAELSLSNRRRWMDAHAKPQNFDGLLDAWLDALDTDALNKKFYQELFKWFERAQAIAQFPPNGGVAPKDHIIRMLTRLIFIWFIKEKKLVHPNLFIERQAKKLLKDYNRDNGDSYYRAVLQNLFFATLNTEIDKRRFSRDNRADHRNPGLYRYKDLMARPDDMLAMFKDTPFVNGGLFDCLDDFAAATAGGRRVDCFTNNPTQRKELSVPNRLFFGERGLIALFHRYKFTVEENTPLEQEVALDPELLGNVFENLLAATTRETQETARKQTGSYYTPRAVVDYMVDESLIAALSEKVAPANANRERLRNNLRQLLSYGEDDERAAAPFTSAAERNAIVKAVAELKIIDPAVGSGAFPMGILHKLTLALRRIDPDNDLWAAAQVEIAVDRTRQVYAAENDARRREHIQRRINADFERHKDSDFGRKLYLIQNAIYGVDIQPIAAQIAKLRFFISLAIEQSRSNDSADNYGIRALPNLETRFVAANALIGLTPGGDFNRLMDDNKGATRQIAALNDLRARHIAAADRQDKLDIISQERQAQARLAHELDKMRADWETGQTEAIELKTAALNKEQQAIVRKAETAKYENRKAKFESEFADAQKIAAWKPLDHNAPAADWFDAKYMFDVKDGFDVVIGNPPYVVSKDAQLRRIYKEGIYGRMNLYGVFIQRGLQLLDEGGQLAFINPRTLLTDRYFTNLRKVVKRDAELRSVVMIADRHNTFASVLQECILLQLERRKNPSDSYLVNTRAVHLPADLTDPLATNSENSGRVLLGDNYHSAFYIGNSDIEYEAMERMNAAGVRLADLGISAATGKVQFDKYRQYAQPDNADNACRLIWAENTQRYAWRASEKRVGKEWLSNEFASVMPPNITGAGIVTQRISANEQPRRIIASLVTPAIAGSSSAYSENHTNFIPVEDETKGAFLLAALNSSPMEFIFRRLNSNTQVSAGELNALPFPPIPNDDALAEIAGVVSELVQAGGVDCDTANAARLIALERELDILIGALYGFSPREVEQMQGMLASYEVVYGAGRRRRG